MKRIIRLAVMSAFITASPVLAHDHGGSHDSMDHGSSQSVPDAQNAKEAEALLSSCSRQANNLQWRLNKLQADMVEKHASAPDREELKKLEQKLREANEIVKYLKVF